MDISGPCDEAEHANDPRCTGAGGGRVEDDHGDDRHGGGQVDNSGPGNAEDRGDDHVDNSGPGNAEDFGDDDMEFEDHSGSGHGGGDDDGGGDDNSGHGGGGDDD